MSIGKNEGEKNRQKATNSHQWKKVTMGGLTREVWGPIRR